MQRTTDCGCGCGQGHAGVMERPRYFPRQLITPDDMNLEQAYFRDKMRRHNKYLHGWGVVCGAQVCAATMKGKDASGKEVDVPKPWTVVVQPGYVLGPGGDEIYIDCPREVDVRTSGLAVKSGEPAGAWEDPWCTPVRVPNNEAGTVYIGVRYKEFKTRKVPVYPAGCGCDDTQCEESRWCDGYEICILDSCPDSHKGPPPLSMVANAKTAETLVGNPSPPCPGCSDDCVVLAKVSFNAEGTFGDNGIDHCACRRNVLSFGHVWWGCGEAVTDGTNGSGGVEPPTSGECEIVVHRIVAQYKYTSGAPQMVREITRHGGTADSAIKWGPVPHDIAKYIEVTLEGDGFLCGNIAKETQVSVGQGLRVESSWVERVELTNSRQRLIFQLVRDEAPVFTPGFRSLTIINAVGKSWRLDNIIEVIE